MKTNKIIPSALLLTLLSLFSPAPAHATTFYVAPWGYNPPRNPGTLEFPWASMQFAFNAAATSGDTIILYDGTYVASGCNLRGKSVTFRSLSGPTNCILDFAMQNAPMYLNTFDGGNPVMAISGFTFRNSQGGCLVMTNGCTVTISNCIFTANSQTPAISIANSTANTFIRNCVFTGNAAQNGGAAIMATGTGRLEVWESQFFGNQAYGISGGGCHMGRYKSHIAGQFCLRRESGPKRRGSPRAPCLGV